MSMGMARFSRLFFAACCSTLLSALTVLPQEVRFNPDVFPEIQHDQSPPLWEIRPPVSESSARRVIPLRQLPRPRQNGISQADSVLQNSVESLAAPALITNFEGIGEGLGNYTVTGVPPDTNGAVGPNHFVQIVNVDLAVFSKAGTVLLGPVPINTLWSGFGGGCEIDNDGDPIVQYDKQADRWVISQFAVTTTHYLQCVAVSKTSDPTGSYNRYSFMFTDFPDYPKLSVWPDAYYMTFNMFVLKPFSFSGGEVCALDRSKMLAGLAATMHCFNTGVNFFGLLPSDLDGKTSPPAGSPNFVVALDTTSTLAFWKFHVDWTNPANTTLTGPASINVATYAMTCPLDPCIPQPGGQTLDSLADRLMYRFAYRNFGDHESLVVNHSVAAGGTAGVRWYEIRSPNTSPTIFQQGTYAPDSNWRWMGSIAMDQAGDIAVGYSVSSNVTFPDVRFTGRLASDSTGVMTQGEGVIVFGAGSQNGGISRWGDYSSIAVDPTDDCTFWYTNEFLKTTGSFNWSTQIASFKLPSCPPSATHYSVTAPASATAGTSFSITVKALDAFGNVATGYTGTVHFTSTDPLAVLPANSTLVSGVKTFTVTLKSAGTRTITATDTVLSTITGSVNVTVKAASATHYALSAPASVTAGVAFSVTVKALDAFGNVATGYTGTAHFTSTDPLAVLPANSTLVSGAKTFSVTLKTKGTQTITATDTVNATIRGSTNVSVS